MESLATEQAVAEGAVTKPEAPPARAPQPDRNPRLPYLPALDGLRALAVIAVILYHADTALRGGFLGVEVFFVISGYLITSLLLAEWQLNGNISFKGFWLRRARRLLPAVYLLLVVVLAYSVLFLPDEVAGLRSDAAASAVYVTNWYLIFSHKSYFEAFGRPSLLRHLWSLAVEEQFYLLWPLLFFAAMRFLRVRRRILAAVLAGAAASSLLMAMIYRPEIDPSRVYYGTDTRAAGLLLGVALAFVWAPGVAHRLPFLGNGDDTTRAKSWTMDILGIVALAALLVFNLVIGEYDPFLYRGGFVLVGLATLLLIAVTVDRHAVRIPRMMAWGPLVWIGLRSYGIYLWHWPVVMLTRPQMDVPLDGLPLFALRMVLTIGLAALSFRFIEMPIRKGARGRLWQQWRGAEGAQRRALNARWAAACVAILVFSTALGQSVVNAQPPPPPAYLALQSVDTLSSATPTPVAGSASATTPASGTSPGDALNATQATASATRPFEATPSVATPALVTVSPVRPLVWGYGFWVFPVRLPIITVTQRITTSQVVSPNAVAPGIGGNVDHGELLDMRADRRATEEPTATSTMTPTMTQSPAVVIETPTPPAPEATPQPPVQATPEPVTSPEVTATVGPWPYGHVSLFGESVMIAAEAFGDLKNQIGDYDASAEQGRQVDATLRILQARKAANQLGPIVVLHVGNNGTFVTEQFDRIMAILADRKLVVFMNIKGGPYEAGSNAVISEGIKRYPNVVLADWRATSINHPEYFWPADYQHMHLKPEGAKVYTELIVATIKSALQGR